MAKRFTDSNKWDDPWFESLSNDHKACWSYILDKCNHAGIYKHCDSNFTHFLKGVKFEMFLEVSEDRLKRISKDKYFIPKFIDYQYGELSANNRAHNSVIQILEKEGAYKPHGRGMDADKDKDKDKDKIKYNKGQREKWFLEYWVQYPASRRQGKDVALKRFLKSVTSQEKFEQFKVAFNKYINSEKIKEGYILRGSRWFEEWADWLD